MGPFDLFWHLLNLFAVPLLAGVLAAAGAKLLWYRDLAAARLPRLILAACAACAGVTASGLVAFGADGRMATYGLMPIAAAAALWWVAFGPGRR